MNALQKLRDRIQKKACAPSSNSCCDATCFPLPAGVAGARRDGPAPPHNLKPYPPTRSEFITVNNADAFARYFGDRVETMRELAAEGYTGLMYLDDRGDTVGFAWASTRDYFDRHFYRCNFPINPGEYFQFGGEMTRAYWGPGCRRTCNKSCGKSWQERAAKWSMSATYRTPRDQDAPAHGFSGTRQDHPRVLPVRSLAVFPRHVLQRLGTGRLS